VLLPDQWRTWVEVVARNVAAGKNGTWASLPIPLLVRLPLAVAIIVWGARTDRAWTVPLASMVALPAVWYGGLSMLLAVIPLLPGRGLERYAPAVAAAGRPRTRSATITAPARNTAAPAQNGAAAPNGPASAPPTAGPTTPAA